MAKLKEQGLKAGAGPAVEAAWFLENFRTEVCALTSQHAKLSCPLSKASKKVSDADKRGLLSVALLGRGAEKGSCDSLEY